MSQKKYLFDSDSLIVAKNIHYSPNFCPQFWDWIVDGNKHKTFFTIDKVADELMNGKEGDYLRGFVETHKDNFVLETNANAPCIKKYAAIQQWANTEWAKGKKQNKVTKALEVFAKEKTADPWLVAYASTHGYIIISNEQSAPDSQSSVKLPDVARAFEVKVALLHEVLAIHSGRNFSFK